MILTDTVTKSCIIVIKALQTKNLFSEEYYEDAKMEMYEATVGTREDKKNPSLLVQEDDLHRER